MTELCFAGISGAGMCDAGMRSPRQQVSTSCRAPACLTLLLNRMHLHVSFCMFCMRNLSTHVSMSYLS